VGNNNSPTIGATLKVKDKIKKENFGDVDKDAQTISKKQSNRAGSGQELQR
jgi:hypothetical protein